MQSTSITEIHRLFHLQSQHENLMRLRKTTASERLQKIRRIKKALLLPDNIKKMTDALHADLRKSAAESEANELAPVLMAIRHLEDNLRKWMAPRKVGSPLALSGLSSHVRYESKGCVLVIAPWNYPFQLVLMPLLHALAAGNAVIVKPSEFVPATSKFLFELLKGLFDEREVAFVFGDAEVAKEVLNMPFHHIFFTGSPQVGKLVMQAASRHLTSVTLELGGKSPVFVHDSYDIAIAARKIAWAKTMNCGQTCIAPDYVLIPEGSTEHFVQAYERAIKDFYNPQGKGIDKSVDYSRLIHRKHFQRLKSLLETDIQAGAKVLSGGNMNENDLFIEPILVSNLQSSMGLMREEIFGPILPICTYRNITEAIAQVNELERPLSLYIFSNNNKITEQILVNTTSGGVAINELMVTSVNPALPFGGVNHSGMGRSNGQAGFVSFSNEKGIVRRRWGTFSPIFPPYKSWLVRMLRKISSW